MNSNIMQNIARWEQEKKRILNVMAENLLTDEYLCRMSNFSDIDLTRVMRLLYVSLGECIARTEQSRTAHAPVTGIAVTDVPGENK